MITQIGKTIGRLNTGSKALLAVLLTTGVVVACDVAASHVDLEDAVQVEALEGDIQNQPRPSAAIGTCTYRTDTVSSTTSFGEIVNYSPACQGTEKRTGGGCNTDVNHDDHTWLTDSYPWTDGTWRCAMYHNDNDAENPNPTIGLGAYVMCCT